MRKFKMGRRDNRYLKPKNVVKILKHKFIKSLEIEETLCQSYLNLIDFNKNTSLMLKISKKLTKDHQNKLLHIIYQSKQTDSINLASSNAITLLNFSNFAFKDLDFSNIKIPYANLSNSQLINTSFEYSDLSSTNFNQSHLYNCNFKGSDLSNTNFGICEIEKIDSDVIHQFHYDDNGDLLVACSNDQWSNLEVWNRTQKRLLLLYTWKSNQLQSVIFSAKHMAVNGPDYRITVWNLNDFKVCFEYCIGNQRFNNLVFSPCNKFIAFRCRDHKIYIFDVMKNQKIAEIYSGTQGLESVSWSLCSKYLSSFNSSNIFCIWELKSCILVHKRFLYKYLPNYIRWFPHKTLIGFIVNFRSILLWNFKLKENAMIIDAFKEQIVMTLSDREKNIAYLINQIKMWDISSQKTEWRFFGDKNEVTTVIFDENEENIITSASDRVIKKWRISKLPSKPIENCLGSITSVALSAKNDIFVSGSTDNLIKIWCLSNLTCIHTLDYHKNPIRSLCISPCGDYLASGDWSGLIVIYDLINNQIFNEISESRFPITALSFDITGKILTSARTDSNVWLYNIETLNIVQSIENQSIHEAFINFMTDIRTITGTMIIYDINYSNPMSFSISMTVSWSKDDEYTTSRSENKRIAIYEVKNQSFYWDVYQKLIKYSPDKKVVAFTDGGYWVRVWDLENKDASEGINNHGYQDIKLKCNLAEGLTITVLYDVSLKIWNLI